MRVCATCGYVVGRLDIARCPECAGDRISDLLANPDSDGVVPALERMRLHLFLGTASAVLSASAVVLMALARAAVQPTLLIAGCVGVLSSILALISMHGLIRNSPSTPEERSGHGSSRWLSVAAPIAASVMWIVEVGSIARTDNVFDTGLLLVECLFLASVIWVHYGQLMVARACCSAFMSDGPGAGRGRKLVLHGIWGAPLAWLLVNGGCLLGFVAPLWLAATATAVAVSHTKAAVRCAVIIKG